MTKKELAQSICNLVGESNIRTIANCYTRVRLTVKDPGNIKREELKKLEGVLGVIEEGSHVQVVLGPGTAAVCPDYHLKVTSAFGSRHKSSAADTDAA